MAVAVASLIGRFSFGAPRAPVPLYLGDTAGLRTSAAGRTLALRRREDGAAACSQRHGNIELNAGLLFPQRQGGLGRALADLAYFQIASGLFRQYPGLGLYRRSRPAGTSDCNEIGNPAPTYVRWPYAPKSCNSSPASTMTVHAIEASTRTVSRVKKTVMPHDINLRIAGLIARRSAATAGRKQIQIRVSNRIIKAGKTGNVGSVVNRA